MIQKTDKFTISEARFNDLVYLILKKLYFEPCGWTPRECDIRICMQMSAPEAYPVRPTDMILAPDEQSGRSHDKMVEVCIGTAFDVCLTYIEEHWMHTTLAEVHGDPNIKQGMWDWCNDAKGVFETVLNMPEEECGG